MRNKLQVASSPDNKTKPDGVGNELTEVIEKDPVASAIPTTLGISAKSAIVSSAPGHRSAS